MRFNFARNVDRDKTPPPTADEIQARLDYLGLVAAAAREVVRLSRHWFSVRGDPLAGTKGLEGAKAIQEVWNAQRQLELLFYPPERLTLERHDKEARVKGRGDGVYEGAAAAITFPVSRAELNNAVSDLARRHDALLRHLRWLAAFFGEMQPWPEKRAKPPVVSPEFLDSLEQGAAYLGKALDRHNQFNRLNRDAGGRTGRRPCYNRDHTWLRWQEDKGMKPSGIRDQWNAENPKSKVTIEVVKKGLTAAKRDRG
jgi:hypothetical protein